MEKQQNAWLYPLIALQRTAKKKPEKKEPAKRVYNKPYSKEDIKNNNGRICFLAKAGRFLYIGTELYSFFNSRVTKTKKIEFVKKETYEKMLKLVIEKDPDFIGFTCNVKNGKVELQWKN